ncbi:hypothetical protein, partial [Hydrogenivirga sp. 128-5-R1-1]|uniref:hypothetical protein n=1 Tax=Hydrogenivirga sp. 128-5-R1-1 TaxID=392423 RepID=UPI00015EF71A
PRIAVIDFANNTTFDLAKVVHPRLPEQLKGKKSRWCLGCTAGPAGIGVGHVGASASKTDWKRQAQTVSRDVNARLGESIAEAVSVNLPT